MSKQRQLPFPELERLLAEAGRATTRRELVRALKRLGMGAADIAVVVAQWKKGQAIKDSPSDS
jgi:hypothetical protein